MSPLRLCGVRLHSVGVLAVLMYIIDTSLAQDDQGFVQNEDYPNGVYNEVPKNLLFTCDDKLPGYYADPQTNCQVWHWCVPSIGGNLQYSFVCAPGTVFNQRLRVCDWDYKTDCPNSQSYYGINEDLYKDDTGNYINGKK
ncbi:U-scoloptoxin(01)-Cw1a-like [Leguminivora glycinivorella]|uniref:U-scoloptoxin(01)-Cw1a-like n=1 Tax=Leguminivora glycinivorella TaxID=1035111 RepID=UPI00200D056F|nr:U-scoloptoxin(01)-Cw1a-like [Leguminivora glycinivorella]